MFPLRAFCFCLAATLMCPCPGRSVPEQAVSEARDAVYLSIVRDSRVVEDTATLNLGQITPDQSWAVAKVKSDPDSPTGHTVGAYIEAETGKFVTTPGWHDVITVHGSINLLSVVSGTPPADLSRYEWEVKEFAGPNDPKEDRIRYSLFRGGTEETALLQINEKAQGAAKFEQSYLIPPEWAALVVPAVKRLQGGDDALKARLSTANQASLQKLLLDENPFVAASVGRQLSEGGLLDAAFARGPLSQARDLRQALLSFFYLNQSIPESTTAEVPPDQRPERKDALADALNEVIDAAKSAEELKGIALGAYTTRKAIKGGGMSQWLMRQRASGILQRIDKKQASFNSHQAADNYIDVMLTSISIRERAKTVSVEKPK